MKILLKIRCGKEENAMTAAAALKERIARGDYDARFAVLYGREAVEKQRRRYSEAVDGFTAAFGEAEQLILFSAPGRTEIGGNHTDHNHGRVLAASVNLDVIAVAAPRRDAIIRVQSKGYDMDTVVLGDWEVQEAEKNHSASLIRGVAARFVQLGYAVGGFDAYTTSDVLKGSGLSSSAAFEVLVGTILNGLYNDGAVSAVEIAKAAQYAENVYFGKPSGLMDQTASSVGGIVTIDFADPERPVIRAVDFDFASCGHKLCIVDTGGNHADLTHEYAAVTVEMRAAANMLGVDFLRDTTPDKLISIIPALREKHGDRAVLRALHFFGDNDRVVRQVAALEAGDFGEFKRLVVESGHSSFEYLQNVYAASDVQFQGLSIALALAQRVLDGCGAWRVHGGGFGGTTQNFVPEDKLEAFRTLMEGVFGEGSCHVLSIRPVGGVCLDKE